MSNAYLLSRVVNFANLATESQPHSIGVRDFLDDAWPEVLFEGIGWVAFEMEQT